MKQLIITGDDFGLSLPVNEAIEIAHRIGVLSATSLIVGEEASADAVDRALNLPDLRVGLHVVLVQGTPVLAAEQIPDLVTREGLFRNDLFLTGVRFFLKPGIRRQLEAEIRAQFQAFLDTGLQLDHVNAHNHMHLHPTILALILKIGRAYGMQAMRIPYEPLFNFRYGSALEKMGKIMTMIGLSPWTTWMRHRLNKAAIFSNDYIFGLNDSGRMNESLLLRLIRYLPKGTTELYFHPATHGDMEIDQDAPAYQYESELAALTSPKAIALLNHLGITPMGFSDFIKPRKTVASGYEHFRRQ